MIDFETTDLKTRCPIQVGLVIINDKLETLYEFETLIKPFPGAEWSDQAEAVHGIKQSQLRNAPSIENVALMLAGIFKCYESWVHPNTLIYHANGEFDIKILNDLMLRGGLMGNGMPIRWNTYNTLKEAKKHKIFDKYGLSHIMEKLNFKYQAHDAKSDCFATIRLMEEIQKYET